MSKMIPRESIDALRDNVDVSLDAYGIDCVLFIPSVVSYDNAEKLDAYAEPGDYEHISYSAKVFVEWNPSTYRLKKLGVYVEDQLPILVWFGNKATALTGPNAGTEVAIDVTKQSYFRINPEFIPNNTKEAEEYELVNPVIKGLHDAVIRKGYSAVPRRVQI